jgi:four helix bundle protein
MIDFKKLDIWNISLDFVRQVYKLTADFPQTEIFGLTSQLRRAAVSVSSNIAEGCGRRTTKDFVRFLYQSYGSLKECENLLIISKKLQYLDESLFNIYYEKIDELSRKLFNLIKAANRNSHIANRGAL